MHNINALAQRNMVPTTVGKKAGSSVLALQAALCENLQIQTPCQYQVAQACDCMQVMRWMEQCAYIAASRVGRGGHLLTGSMDSIIFTQPTRVGDVMYITAQVPSLLPLS